MAALSLLPIWVFMYVRSLTAPPEEAAGPLGDRRRGVRRLPVAATAPAARAASAARSPSGEVLVTFPHIEDQLRFVYFGTAEYNLAGVAIYGNPDREGGPHVTGSFGPMPAQGQSAGGELTDAEILAVVCHERYTLGGAELDSDEYAEEFENWCSEEAPTFVALEEGATLDELADEGLTERRRARRSRSSPIGDAPVEGRPPG